MVPEVLGRRIVMTVSALLVWNATDIALSQQIKAPLDSGFARTSSIAMSVDEMFGPRKVRASTEPILGPGYPALWIAEVQYKPVRLMRLELRDPKTGTVRRELVRYMVYRMIMRDYTELAGAEQAELQRKLNDPNLAPANTLDPQSTLPLHLPRFVLKTEDEDLHETYLDEINLDIQKAVFQREFGRRGLDLKMMNSAEAISEVGEPVAGDDKDALSGALYGVAVWRNVDPRADLFSVIMSGFSNAYRISTDASGKRVVEEKVIVQRFARPGDEFDQEELEFRLIDDLDTDGDGRIDVRFPNWQYQERDVNLNVDHMDTVLRNVKASFVDAAKAAPGAGQADGAVPAPPQPIPAEAP